MTSGSWELNLKTSIHQTNANKRGGDGDTNGKRQNGDSNCRHFKEEYILAPGIVGHACNPSTEKVKQGDQEFKIILDYIANMSPAWSKWDLVSKTSK